VVTNAIEAMREGGILTVTSSYVKQGPWAQVEFKDNGPGMPEEVLARVKRGLVVTTKPDGLGFGLGIVRNVIENEHRGQMDVSSQQGKGTTVTIRIPMKTP
jgi:signal transduction histidine kinase